ncbi:MAG: ABC transporter ATP-binding protein [Armatimonadota bacterium]|nr:ABC transporter ATP-binding protein [Armatimonadota bacterium]MDR7468525.1 ABC transporter ATP-binding protein [Armatimonadota bacterium]MDR7474501.1 ABC transporter ATP-binding protein [Armatimonadota bacterium]MDR7539824.1 ABC transporter ATP-binding protein [Armatimonadota bacterium]
MPRLEIRDLTVRFGGLLALDRVGFDVPEGQIVGLIGPNGAGKTTLLNAVSRFVEPEAGSIRFDGREILAASPHEIVGYGIGRTFQGVVLFSTMTVQDTMLVGLHAVARAGLLANALMLPQARREQRKMRDRVREVASLLGLEPVESFPVSALPFAVQKRVDLARALVSLPRLLLLDEPAAGLAPEESQELGALLQRIRDRYGCAMLLVEHDMALVMDICDHIVVLNFGQLIASGRPHVVRSDPAVIEAYLGEAARA